LNEKVLRRGKFNEVSKILNEVEEIIPRIEISKKLLILKEIYSKALEKGIKYKQ
jgi:hypothetical protein